VDLLQKGKTENSGRGWGWGGVFFLLQTKPVFRYVFEKKKERICFQEEKVKAFATPGVGPKIERVQGQPNLVL